MQYIEFIVSVEKLFSHYTEAVEAVKAMHVIKLTKYKYNEKTAPRHQFQFRFVKTKAIKRM